MTIGTRKVWEIEKDKKEESGTEYRQEYKKNERQTKCKVHQNYFGQKRTGKKKKEEGIKDVKKKPIKKKAAKYQGLFQLHLKMKD